MGTGHGDLAERFDGLWDEFDSPPDVSAFLREHASAPLEEKVRVLLADGCRRRAAGLETPLEEHVEKLSALGAGEEQKIELIAEDFRGRLERGERADPQSVVRRFPDLGALLIERLERLSVAREPPSRAQTDDRGGTPTEVFDDSEWEDAVALHHRDPVEPPRIPRFRIERLLQEAGFKTVYLATDEDLGRAVAIKVPRRDLVSEPEDIERFLSEGRVIAGLDHPGIVPVYEAGRTDDGGCYLVEKYIEGRDLSAIIADSRPPSREAALLVASVAEALHHVHLRGVVHRDIKPANILVDPEGKPYVTDFGLALRLEDLGKWGQFAGTAAYMSPEQAREEGHLVDGRTDIFSLGTVLYELLTGKLPFPGSTVPEVLERIRTLDPRPPRQIDDGVPRELERICLKALSKRSADRHSAAIDLAEDLRSYAAGPSRQPAEEARSPEPALPPAEREKREALRPATAPPRELAREEPPGGGPGIVPRGLRSFEAEDAGFFLDLLPGPHDRAGLPEAIRFWKHVIEVTDPDRTFRVGVIYGPSGCGKSSLVKAGLLPCLAPSVEAVFLEAGGSDTEERLVRALRKRWPIEKGLGAVEAVRAIRRGDGPPPSKKVLLVIDQLEQWLHTRAEIADAELVRALRQCDGARVQCLLLVRDDFWMAVTRLMRELELPLVEGKNSAAVDLFDLRHARNVLEAFGRAYGTLPETGDLSRSEESFVSEAVDELATDGKVMPVQLALFCEMVKGRSWSTAVLREVGGLQGVGVRFLEETFSSRRAPPEHRYHEKAARSVLRSLLPEDAADLRRVTRSRKELLVASGYERDTEEFARLLAILDGQVRLLTPVDPATDETGSTRDTRYQLTHDYLVPPLREWLSLKERETRRGRAELLLREQSALWNARPERKRLPTIWEWVNLLFFTRWSYWTETQTKMMRRGGLLHVSRLAAVVVFVVLLLGGEAAWRGWQASRLVGEAREAWEAGRGSWPLACSLLERAHAYEADHPEVESFLRKIAETGALVVTTRPAGAEVEVTPDPEEGPKVGLELEPQLRDENGPFTAGDRILLKPGHYRVRVRHRSLAVDFPVFVSQVLFEDRGESWEEVGRLLPKDVSLSVATERPDGGIIRFAEEQRLEGVDLIDVPLGYVYVPPGPYYRAAGWDLSSGDQREGPAKNDNEWFRSTCITRYDVVPAHLEHGFIIGRSEVSAGEFSAWFDRHHEEIRKWRIDSRAANVLRYFQDVPLDALRDPWERYLTDEAFTSHEAFSRARAEWDMRHWGSIADPKFKRKLAAQAEEDPLLPVVNVNLDYAVYYARTHAPIDMRELARWLEREQERLSVLLDELRALHERLGASERVVARELPHAIRLRRSYGRTPEDRYSPGIRFEQRSLLACYADSLWWADYRCQAPVEGISGWAIENPEALDQRLRKELSLLKGESRSVHPFRHLFSAYREKVRARAARLDGGLATPGVQANAARDIPLDTGHLRRWIEAEIENARRKRERLELLRARLEAAGTGEDADAMIPWDVRSEYGWSVGWGLATVGQWEKACRGVDARPNPWGDRPGKSNVEGNLRRCHAFRDPAGSLALEDDISPYGVILMSGNVSEWVLPDDPGLRDHPADFLKGGNWFHPAIYSRAGALIHVRRLGLGEYAGFRAISSLRGSVLEAEATVR